MMFYTLEVEKVSCLFLSVSAEIDSTKYFRLDDSKVLAWLYHKVNFDVDDVCLLECLFPCQYLDMISCSLLNHSENFILLLWLGSF